MKRTVRRKMSCSFSTENSVCGPTPYAPNELHVIPLEACRKDLTEYLTKLGVSGSRGIGTRITECEVILNRPGLHSLSKEERERITVCPKHRYELTTHYQKLPSSCSYPSHKGETKKLKNPRRVNKQVSEEIYHTFHISVPIGSGKYIAVQLFSKFSCHVLIEYFRKQRKTCYFCFVLGYYFILVFSRSLSAWKSFLIRFIRCFVYNVAFQLK